MIEPVDPPPKPKTKAKTGDVPAQLKPYTWKPGQSGNPSGKRHKTHTMTARLAKRLNEMAHKVPYARTIAKKIESADDATLSDIVIDTLLIQCIGGNMAAINKVFEAIDGKVPDRLAGYDGGPLVTDRRPMIERVFSDPETMELAVKLANKVRERATAELDAEDDEGPDAG